ncbi:hypothetical protein HWQ46_20250 [Shewanella sp. D64]|uniref:hypothetical protein n=1 Tax=unclassified Shewanella TaxID=196818 RepID=UPI0022BA3DB3|nr:MULTISPECIES: hypothetical protein [unclassified Shewanella]MEC4727870.1 hypothetical protein [Shewanella sp. D64]MEC4739912.1 hypothetical protein [Shewanella sp. E94]WBJ97123.1 hypothetical protein HWQ47_08460 [Shewanella sp. MTB7]
MSVIKTMSIVGMVFFSLCLVLTIAFAETDLEAAAGWGMFAAMYGIGYSITVYIKIKGTQNTES